MFKALIRSLFYRMPKKGQIYEFDNFGCGDSWKVLIDDIYLRNIFFHDIQEWRTSQQYMSRGIFHFCYKLVRR